MAPLSPVVGGVPRSGRGSSYGATGTWRPPGSAEVMTRIGQERGWPPTNRRQFDASLTPRGALLVGSPQAVVDKVLFEHELFKHDRFMAQIALGAMPHDKVMKAIELFGTQVAPAIRKAISASELVG